MNDLSASCTIDGLRINLIRQPEASRAAALFRLSAGSFDEPPSWPGLAHLLEHVLFAGSDGFQHEQRLMAWAPAHGGQLNATTRAHFTAWFVEIAPEQLLPALCRLTDMLARPLLAHDAIAAEAAAIEAEYRLLQGHGPTLCEAALSQAFAAPHPLHEFHVGSQRHFGDDPTSLRQALLAYHQQFFHAGKLELWLSGPQPLAELRTLAEKAAAAFPRLACADRALPPLRMAERRAFALQSAATQQLQLSFVIEDPDSASFALLRELLTDKARGSLLATLREQGLCDEISLLEPYRSDRQSVLSVVFQGAQLPQSARIETLFRHWLTQLPALTPAQRAHYASLTQRRFGQLSVLDRLRELALGFPPAEAATAPPVPQNLTRLYVSPEVKAPTIQSQGFTLKLAAIDWPETSSETPPALRFYTPAPTPAAPALPMARSALSHIAATGEPTLLLSLQPGQRLCRRIAANIEAALQPAMGDALHSGGELTFSREHGLWLLRLSGIGTLMPAMLAQALSALRDRTETTLAYGERLFHKARQAEDIAIRNLLAQLPDLLTETPGVESLAALRWQATLYGGTAEDAETLARLLTEMPGTVESLRPSPYAFPNQPRFFCPTPGQEAAALVFCPLAEASDEGFLNWQLLATLFAPRFFQRLRVEANIGYVVSCRFHQTAGQAGLLFALQSPSLSATALLRHIELFITGMAETVKAIAPETLKTSLLSLPQVTPAAVPKNREQITAHWLYRQLSLASGPVSPSPERLQQAYRQLIGDRARWRLLSSEAL